MHDLHKLTIKQAVAGLQARQFSSVELTKACLEQINKHSDLNAYVKITDQIALQAARDSDARIKNSTSRKLEGLPIGIKDLFCTKGVRTTACSKILSNFIPEYESSVSQNILDNGGIMLGKTNCDEFAMGSSNLTSYFGPCVSPWRSVNQPDNPLVPGGSSGGSSAAVAAFMAFAALGTDTGGSIRQPASFTGIVGIKPTYGRCSRFGTIAFASSLDQAGVFARTVYDSALVLESIMGPDPKDSTSIDKPVPDLIKATELSIKGLRIGMPVNLLATKGIDKQVIDMWHNTADLLRQEGAQIVEIDLTHAPFALPVYYVIAPAEASSNLARYDGVRFGQRVEDSDLDSMYQLTRSQGLGDEVKRRIMIGTYVLSSKNISSYYTKAQQVRQLICNDFASAFEKVDAIITPSAPSEAFPLNIKQDDPTLMYLNDIFTIPASLAGLPAMSVPAAMSNNGLPLGMQIVGRHFDEEMIVALGSAIERNININFTPKGF
jgi:aspartyl-tRNA(Asn)/glutamyl-tRNA(Gln) amidotransferase subunit A